MGITCATNITSMTAQRNLRQSTMLGDTTTQRLASGKRVNTAKDDPSNLQISNRFTAQINCLDRGNRNASEGEAVAQIAEGALAENFSILQRIRQLAIQSSNGTVSDEDRATMQKEVSELCSELTRVACKTTYGGAQILRGSGNGIISDSGKLSVQVGANANTTLDIDLSTSFTMEDMVNALGGVSDGNGYDAASKSFDVSSSDNAQKVLASIDTYIEFIDTKRAELGAVQNRISSSISNQENIIEQESDARSRMIDADYALETSNLAVYNTRQNATSQMLMQANARPNIVASLLGG